MSTWAIAVCGVLYLVTAFDLWRQGQVGLALTFLFYACANVGLLMAAHRV